MTQRSLFGDIDGLGLDEVRERLRALQSIIARAPIPIAIAHDPQCRVITANGALAAMLGMPEDANISLTPPPGQAQPYRIQRNGRDVAPADLPMQYAVAHRIAVSNEIEIVRADGSMLFVKNDVEPLYDAQGRIYGAVSVCVDLTERKRAERALLDADQRKDEFLATLSHELRNPLAPLRTALEVLRLAKDDPDLAEKARQTMERQLAHLARLTDDLLDVSRITQNKVELRRERVDLCAALHSAVETTWPSIDSYDHTLRMDLPTRPVWVLADATRLAQVFSNLLSNAARYTPRGGRIFVTAAVDGDRASIVVADTGVGIPSDLLPRVFDMFTQLAADRDRTHRGLGIGLTLAKRLVELHDGNIEARSDGPGHGSQFIVRLPVQQDRDASIEPTSTDAESITPSGCRVLVAEDDPDAAEMMEVMLQYKGHDVRLAGDGEQAVAIAEDFHPQIAFLDIGMPRMDGYEAARRIRAALGRRVMLVALTGWGQDEDKRRSRDAGFDHHLTKPPEPEMLDKLIAMCVGRDRPDARV
jgi:PAS domain S-box-containing protein